LSFINRNFSLLNDASKNKVKQYISHLFEDHYQRTKILKD